MNRDYDLALQYYFRSHQILLATLDVDHPDVAESLNGMGNVYNSLGQYDKALNCYDRSLKISLATHGENHLEIANLY